MTKLQREVKELKEQVLNTEGELWTRRKSCDEMSWCRARLEEAEAELQKLRAVPRSNE